MVWLHREAASNRGTLALGVYGYRAIFCRKIQGCRCHLLLFAAAWFPGIRERR